MGFDDRIKKSICEYSSGLNRRSDLIKDRKLDDLIDRVGLDNLEVLMRMPKNEKGDILKRIKRIRGLK